MQHPRFGTRFDFFPIAPRFRVLLAATWIGLLIASTGEAQEVKWVRQFGTNNAEVAVGVAAHEAGVFVAGHIDRGNFPGESSMGSADLFVRSYGMDGADSWTRQFGTGAWERVWGTASDGSAAYVVGTTAGEFTGETSVGAYDAYVAKLDSQGQFVWARQFGSPNDDEAFGVAVDETAVYVTGTTNGALPGQTSVGYFDVFLRKYDHEGNPIWARQFGTTALDQGRAVALDASGVYVAGIVARDLPGQTHSGSQDAFVRKYDFDGNELWTRQFGTSSSDQGYALAVGASTVVVVGRTSGSFSGHANQGLVDGFARAYDAGGNEMWTQQFGGAGSEDAFGVDMDDETIYITGRTDLALPGQTSAGGMDSYVLKLDLQGAETGMLQFGTNMDDEALAVTIESSGTCVVGFTLGALPEQQSAGKSDAFLIQLDARDEIIPPPALAASLDISPDQCPNEFVVCRGDGDRDDGGNLGRYDSSAYGDDDDDGDYHDGDYHDGDHHDGDDHDGDDDDGDYHHRGDRFGHHHDGRRHDRDHRDGYHHDGDHPDGDHHDGDHPDGDHHDGDHHDGARPSTLTVALAGNENFDVHAVDFATVFLEGIAPRDWVLRDATAPVVGDECGCGGRWEDGAVDAVMTFSREDITQVLGPVANGDVVELTITGQMLDGTPFQAGDCVEIRSGFEAVLYPAVPNPFNPLTRVSFTLTTQSRVTLAVYDVKGRLIDSLVNEVRPSGDYDIYWDAGELPSGVYFFRLEAGRTVEAGRVVLLK